MRIQKNDTKTLSKDSFGRNCFYLIRYLNSLLLHVQTPEQSCKLVQHRLLILLQLIKNKTKENKTNKQTKNLIHLPLQTTTTKKKGKKTRMKEKKKKKEREKKRETQLRAYCCTRWVTQHYRLMSSTTICLPWSLRRLCKCSASVEGIQDSTLGLKTLRVLEGEAQTRSFFSQF